MKNNYNEMVRSFNRSRRKLNRLISEKKNFYKQDILRKRIIRLYRLLTGMQSSLKLGVATCALTIGMVLVQPNAAHAQITFGPLQTNPFGLIAPTAQQNAPAFADLDGDGDLDLMIGMNTGDFNYYRNIGTSTVPSFSPAALDTLGLTNVGTWTTVTFVDLDGDGDKDMMAGELGGSFWYFQNTGTATAPMFAAVQQDPFGIVPTTSESFPTFADIDGDGDMDMLSGQGMNGSYQYYQNTGTASAPAFAAGQASVFGLAFGVSIYSIPVFVDLDQDGDLEVFQGIINTTPNTDLFYYYDNTGTSTAPAFAAPVTNPFGLAGTVGPCPAFGDLDGDGDMDLLVGTYASPGDFGYFENTSGVGFAEHNLNSGISVFPNPSSDVVTVEFDNKNLEATIQVTNELGQVVSTTQTNTTRTTIQLPEEKGVYFVQVISAGNKSSVQKVVKQ